MRRIGVLIIISSLLMLFFVSGCEDSQTVDETGFELVTANCIAIGIRVFIDDEPKEMASSEQPHFYPLPAGTYHLFAHSNATLSINEPDPLCWTMDISISDGNVTVVVLDCDDAIGCAEETGFELMTTNCTAMDIYVYIDGEDQGIVSSEQPHLYPLPVGTYSLFVHSNLDEPDPLCWTREISVSEGNIVEVVLDCNDTGECP